MVTCCLQVGHFRCGPEGRRDCLLSSDHLPGKMPVVNAGHFGLDVDETQPGEGHSSPWGNGSSQS